MFFQPPGFYSLIFDRSGENARIEAVKAQAAAEISYNLLKAKTESLQDQVIYLRTDVKELTTFLREILLQRAAIGSAHSVGGRATAVAALEPVPEIPEVTPVKRTEELPDTLDKLVKTKLMKDMAE